MDVKKKAIQYIQLITPLLFSVYVLLLYSNGKLLWYIHPRFELFTVAFATLAFVGSLVGVFSVLKIDHFHEHNNWFEKSLLGFGIIITLTGFVLAPQTLSSALVINRESNLNSLYSNNPNSLITLFNNSESYTLAEWITLLNSFEDESQYQNAAVSVIGFVADTEESNEVFRVSRFAITCCAVDARPQGLLVAEEKWKDEFSSDDWLEVKGNLVYSDEYESYIIEPTEIIKTERPNQPYIF